VVTFSITSSTSWLNVLRGSYVHTAYYFPLKTTKLHSTCWHVSLPKWLWSKYIRHCRTQSCPQVISELHLRSDFCIVICLCSLRSGWVIYKLRQVPELMWTYNNTKSANVNNCTVTFGTSAFWTRYVYTMYITKLVTGHIIRNNQREYFILHFTLLRLPIQREMTGQSVND
jgi:hypothetical protein